MSNGLIKYEKSNLNDLSGTFDDIGQLIAYLRDLSRQMVPLVDSLVPLSENLNDTIENFGAKLERFLIDNPFFSISFILGIAMIGGYLSTGIIKNILEIKSGLKK